MFDIVASSDGSGIGFESHNMDENSYISDIVETGDTVELQIEEEYIYAEVIGADGNCFTGTITQVKFESEVHDLKVSDEVNFRLEHISRCIHND